jgi:hypothetical protein
MTQVSGAYDESAAVFRASRHVSPASAFPPCPGSFGATDHEYGDDDHTDEDHQAHFAGGRDDADQEISAQHPTHSERCHHRAILERE